MKKIFNLLLLLILLIIVSCSDRNPTNPYDSEFNFEFPPVILDSVFVVDLSALQLRWSLGSEYYTKYIIERSVQNGDFTKIAEMQSGTFVYKDTLVNNEITYTYRIKGMADELSGDYSNEFSGKISLTPFSTFSVTARDDSHIELEWNYRKIYRKSTNRYDFGVSIERKEDAGNFVEIGRFDYGIYTALDSDLSSKKTYIYRVRIFLNDSYSDYATSEPIQTIPLESPENLIAEIVSDQSISLSWIDNCPFEDNYCVERKTNNSEFEEIIQLKENSTSFLDENLLFGETYIYRVRGITQFNQSDYSEEISATIIVLAPTNLETQTIDDQSVLLNWNDNCSFEEGFIIERKENEGIFIEIISTEQNSTSFIDENLIFGYNYAYRIKAFTAENNSDYSNNSSIQTIFPPPTNLTANLLSDTEVQLVWIDNCTFETGYSIERKDTGSTFIPIATISINNAIFVDNTVLCGFEYTYRVVASTDINISGYSNEVSQIVEIFAPSNLSSSATENSISLSWNDNTNIEENYEIERKTVNNDFELIATINSNSEAFTDTEVESMITYFYRVRAVTQNNQSDYSNITNSIVIGE